MVSSLVSQAQLLTKLKKREKRYISCINTWSCLWLSHAHSVDCYHKCHHVFVGNVCWRFTISGQKHFHTLQPNSTPTGLWQMVLWSGNHVQNPLFTNEIEFSCKYTKLAILLFLYLALFCWIYFALIEFWYRCQNDLLYGNLECLIDLQTSSLANQDAIFVDNCY